MSRLLTPRVSLVLVILAAGLRLATLTHQSLWLDEIFSIRVATTNAAGAIWWPGVDPIHPPLYYLVLHKVLGVAGVSEMSARLPSALSSILNLLLIFWLGERVFPGWAIGRLAAVLLALSPLDFWYAQEARMYEMVTTAALCLALGLVIDEWWAAILIVLGLAGGLYLDHTMWPIAMLLVSAWSVRWFRRGRRSRAWARVAISIAAALALCGPVWTQALDVFAGLNAVAPLWSVFVIFGLGCVAAVVVAVAALQRDATRNLSVVAIIVGFTMATVAVAVPRAYNLKHVLVSVWPFATLLAAWALDTRANSTGMARDVGGGAVGTVVVAAISLCALLVTFATPRADWRGVANHLAVYCSPWSVVVLDPPYNEQAMNFYSPGRPIVRGAVSSLAQFDHAEFDVKQACLVAERSGSSPPTSLTEAWMNQTFELQSATSFARLELRCYRVSK